MTSVWDSFIGGWRLAARMWPLVLLVYLVDAAFAVVMAAPPATLLSNVFGRSVLAPELSGLVSLDWLVELQQGADLAAFPWLLYLLVPLVSVLATTFLRGGILEALSAEGNSGLSWTAFLSDCARHFWRLLLLLLFIVPGFLLVVLISLATLQIGLGPGTGGLNLAPAVVRAVLLAVLFFLLPTILDYARLSLVLNPEHSVFRHVGHGIAFAVTRFPRVIMLGLGFWISAALTGILWPVLLNLSPVFGSFWAAFLVQQLSAFLASWQRVAMLGGEMNLYVSSRVRE